MSGEATNIQLFFKYCCNNYLCFAYSVIKPHLTHKKVAPVKKQLPFSNPDNFIIFHPILIKMTLKCNVCQERVYQIHSLSTFIPFNVLLSPF